MLNINLIVLENYKKNNQVKFRIDAHTKMALKRVIENKKVTIQSIMETLLIEYILKNIDSVINEE